MNLLFANCQRRITLPETTDAPRGAYSGHVTTRTSRHQLDRLAGASGLDVLDWGCGTADYRRPVESLGHRYVGLDASGSGADLLGDVHCLPFGDQAFDYVLTNAVLEHVTNPFLAVREVARVLKRGGKFAGSAAFLEPYHYGSLFHLSADGVVHVLECAGLRVDGVWPEEGWLVFDSLAQMHGPISWPSRKLLKMAGVIERLVRRRHYHPRSIGQARWLRSKSASEYRDDMLAITGQVDFVATKV
ncbi:MAG: class I SAM-dependent methyltransferase [bacterium]|nr:class I SAM-dependent methyltransferase [bacterium]